MHSLVLSIPKRGNGAEENQDSHASDDASERWAIADGASGSIYAAKWASLLTHAFVENPFNNADQFAEWLAALQKQWLSEVQSLPNPWYNELKIQTVGGCSTLLGAVARKGVDANSQSPPSRLLAIAFGDSCIFQVRSDELILSHPVKHSSEFSDSPELVGTMDVPFTTWTNQATVIEDQLLEDGDSLFLMTDALAEWFLRQNEC